MELIKASSIVFGLGSIPSLPVGTGTAVTLEAGKKIKAHGTKVMTYLVNKDATDLSLLLKEMPL